MLRATIVPSLALLSSVLVLSGCGDPVSPAPSGPERPTIRVAVTTHGAAFDPDGYSVVLDGEAVTRIDVEDPWIVLHPVTSVSHATVVLDDVAENCAIRDGRDRWSVPLSAGHVARIDFHVDCEAPADLASTGLLFVRGFARDSSDLHVLGPGLTGVRRLTSTGNAVEPHVSADGTRLAFLERGVIHLADIDASEPVVLGPTGRSFVSIAWSPDGSRLAVATGDGWFYGEVGVLSVDEGEPLMFETPGVDHGPSWSSDGSRIVFGRWSPAEPSPRLYTARPDGTDPVLVTRGYFPVWSPVSDDIAYESNGDAFVIDLDSGSEVRLVSGSFDDGWWKPSDWSEDGAFLLLERGGWGDADIFIRRMSDGALYRVTRDGRSHSAVFLDGR